MKKLLLAVIAATSTLAVTIPMANAAVGTGNFNVTATLSSACTIAAIPDLAFGTVTAFVAPTSPTTTATITCTRGLTGVTGVFDSSAVTSSSGAGTTPTGAGLLDNGLYYTLTTAGTGIVSAGTAATLGSIGAGGTTTLVITGAMAAQAGTCTGANCIATPQVRTLTLNY